MNTTVEAVLKAVETGLSLWKEFISTREAAYKRSMDKRMRLCIEYGEKYIQTQDEIDSGKADKKAQELKKKYKTLFFKYN